MAETTEGVRVESDRRVEALRRAVDDAVHQLRAATFTLVSGAIYLFLTGLGTGDRDLLVGRLVNLPLFNANVGLLCSTSWRRPPCLSCTHGADPVLPRR
jgi:hypothetical protein